MQQTPYHLSPADGDSGKRLDRWLAEQIPHVSRSRLKALIVQGKVAVQGSVVTDPALRVRPGWTASVTIPPPSPAEPEPQAAALSILFEDDHLLVVDKPAGMVVHPAPGNPDRTLVNALLAHCGDSLSGIGGVRRPGIVHRLDKDTSGLMVVAKTDRAHQGLAAQFAAHQEGSGKDLQRHYAALVWGLPPAVAGRFDGPIGRDPRNRTRMAVTAKGKPSVTHYRLVEPVGDGCAMLACRLETGRTHQIRVHLSHAGHGLVGDPVYGRMTASRRKALPEKQRTAITVFGRQALDAFALAFRHPETGEALRFTRGLAGDLHELVSVLSPSKAVDISDHISQISLTRL